ncbi:M48 family metallopeptidase [Streptomyces sp. NBC_01381]|uniref:YgjP-like metallopeptidase domain-containing protein n=1 Tax=Streptomyces sp. NBC_01381 TaxID=2903845 RepID=UPI00225A6863|nr:YgjP-like metallopeptidase domain-containing protein [Streptomyces sp. NBC_01381]MCX4666405.1 M48 family metallopeptidase [Streptomyces sp. NBC_01381]
MPASDRTIRVGTIDVTVRTSSRATLAVTVTKSGSIIVRGPRSTTDTDAAALVERRRSWIYRQLTHLAETAPDNPLKELAPGAGFEVLGRPHRLRIVPDDDQVEPLVQRARTSTGDWLHLRRSRILNVDEARQTIINFYAKAGCKWLKINRPQIAPYGSNSRFPVTFSTRMRTNWTLNHPTHGLTLHWATAQLPPTLLQELIHRALGLHTIASSRDLNDALRTLWLGRLAIPTIDPRIQLNPTPTDRCPDCATPPGTLHADRCDIARCAITGFQRAHCHPGSTCNTVWDGHMPGEAECTEYGFYCRPTPDGYEPCNADDPGAMHDFNRLYRECRWNPSTQRMSLPSPRDKEQPSQ